MLNHVIICGFILDGFGEILLSMCSRNLLSPFHMYGREICGRDHQSPTVFLKRAVDPYVTLQINLLYLSEQEDSKNFSSYGSHSFLIVYLFLFSSLPAAFLMSSFILSFFPHKFGLTS